jgi:hypothetical protein
MFSYRIKVKAGNFFRLWYGTLVRSGSFYLCRKMGHFGQYLCFLFYLIKHCQTPATFEFMKSMAKD